MNQHTKRFNELAAEIAAADVGRVAQPTQGPHCEWRDHGFGLFLVEINTKLPIIMPSPDGIATHDAATKRNRAIQRGDKICDLIEEAFNVHTESGMGPRELATSRSKLIALLDTKRSEWAAALNKQNELIAEVKNLEGGVAQWMQWATEAEERAEKSEALCDELLKALKATEREYENLDENAPVDSGCIECTLGTVPNGMNTGPCAHHLRVAAIARAEKVRG